MEPISLKTTKVFLEDTYLFQLLDCTLVQKQQDEKDPLKLLLIFDKTICHPQGGGQPSDSGEIITEKNGRFPISDLSYDKDRENVLHSIKIKNEDEAKIFELGKKFHMEIDEKRRRINARLHSAGHLLDVCVKSLGIDWIPGKGFHFEESPYVEYIGKMPTDEKLNQILTEKCNELIRNVIESNKMTAKVYEYNDIGKVMKTVPEYLPKEKPIRYVKLFEEDEGCPCGGTHVKHVRDLGTMKVVKFTKKGKNVRVSYVVD